MPTELTTKFRILGEQITKKFRLAERILHSGIQDETQAHNLREHQRSFFDFAVDVDLWHTDSPQGSQRIHEASAVRQSEALVLLNALLEILSRLVRYLKRLVRMRKEEGREEPGMCPPMRRRLGFAMRRVHPKVEALEYFALEGRAEERVKGGASDDDE